MNISKKKTDLENLEINKNFIKKLNPRQRDLTELIYKDILNMISGGKDIHYIEKKADIILRVIDNVRKQELVLD